MKCPLVLRGTTFKHPLLIVETLQIEIPMIVYLFSRRFNPTWFIIKLSRWRLRVLLKGPTVTAWQCLAQSVPRIGTVTLIRINALSNAVPGEKMLSNCFWPHDFHLQWNHLIETIRPFLIKKMGFLLRSDESGESDQTKYSLRFSRWSFLFLYTIHGTLK